MENYKRILTPTFRLTGEEAGAVAEVLRNLHSSADCIDSLPDAMSQHLDNDREASVNACNEILRGHRDFQTAHQKGADPAAWLDGLLEGMGQAEQFKTMLFGATVMVGSLYAKGGEKDEAALADWNALIEEYTEKAKALEDGTYLPSLADEDIQALKEKMCELFDLNAEALLSDPNVVKALQTGFGSVPKDQVESSEESRVFQAAALYIAYTTGKLPSLGGDPHGTIYTPYYFGIAASAGSEAADAYRQYANGKIKESVLLKILKAIGTAALTLLMLVFSVAMGLVMAAVIFDVVTAILGFSTLALVVAYIAAAYMGSATAEDFVVPLDKVIEFVDDVVNKAAQFAGPYLAKVKEKAQELWAWVKDFAAKVFEAARVAVAKAVEVGKETIQVISSHLSHENEDGLYETENSENPVRA